MYGSMGRVGLMVPSVNTVVEPETVAMAPEGVNIYATRLKIARSDVEDLKQMMSHVDRAADELASARIDVIAFACTAGSFFEGSKGEERLKERIQEVSGVPAVTTSGAVASALKELGMRNLVMATPYTEDVNCLEEGFLRKSGFVVVRSQGLNIVEAFSIGKVEPDDVYRFALDLFTPEADGTFISCTNLRTIEIIGKLEKKTKRPVVSSNLATFWACLKTLGYSKPFSGFGQLLEK